MDSELSIRRICLSDYEKVLQMTNRLHEFHVSNRPDIYKHVDTTISAIDFKEIVNNPAYIALIAEFKDQPAGYGISKIKNTPDDPLLVKHKTMYIDEIFVMLEYRGKYIGRQLLENLEIMGKELGIERIDLTVWSFNTEAIDFYSSFGMKEQRIILEKKLNACKTTQK